MWTIALEKGLFDRIKSMPDNLVESIVTDPPYELGFMGRAWDSSGIAYNVDMWRECLRVLKPGGYLLSFGGTRTYHRMACAIEDAGFEIRDSIDWIYGSGFPKSRDIGKAIDKEAGAERKITRAEKTPDNYRPAHIDMDPRSSADRERRDIPATDEAKQWEGWGTALKPAHEPIVVARKPLSEKTVANNVLKHGTGGINVDDCRITTSDHWEATGIKSAKGTSYAGSVDGSLNVSVSTTHENGRWPPNILLTHSADCAENCADDCPVAEMDRQSGVSVSRKGGVRMSANAMWGQPDHVNYGISEYNDSGGASRFFPVFEWDDFAIEANFKYQAKAPKKERPVINGKAHPTVKPVALMRWLVILVTPPNGVVLDMYAGSGTTAEACELEGFNSINFDNDPESIAFFNKRMEKYEMEEAE